MTKEQYAEYNAWGLSTLINLYNCDPNIMKSEKTIRQYVSMICPIINSKPWGPCIIHNFGNTSDVFGYSMMQLIETSLVSGHFVNKTKRIFIDIFSCNYYDPIKVIDFSKEFFKAKDFTYKTILRK